MPDAYLDTIRKASVVAVVDIPIIASLNESADGD